MKILLVGAGALGSFIGGVLSKKYDVTILCKSKYFEKLKEKGIKINGKTRFTAHPTVIKKVDSQKIDLIILAVKSYDTNSAMRQITPAIGKNTIVLTLQNGLGNVECISKFVDTDMVLDGVTSHGLTLISNGEVYHAGVGYTTIGTLSGEITEDCKKVCNIFTSVKISTTPTDNSAGERWAKTIVNAGINPITALTGLKNGYLLKIPALTRLLEQTCLECISVANARGIKLPKCDIVEKTKGVARDTSNNKSSMLQDIEKGRRTEIDAMNGAIVRIGKKYGIRLPINFALTTLVRDIGAESL
jgi:2-dehydropantoate 2-reductase